MVELADWSIYIGLFFVALFAATLLPLQSEALLAVLLLNSEQSITILIAVASLGNIIGSTINWWLGYSIHHFQNRAWFQRKKNSLQQAEQWYRRYGRWSLLLSLAPIIGDPLTLIAGILREPIRSFLPIVTIAKTTRYCVIAYITLKISG